MLGVNWWVHENGEQKHTKTPEMGQKISIRESFKSSLIQIVLEIYRSTNFNSQVLPSDPFAGFK